MRFSVLVCGELTSNLQVLLSEEHVSDWLSECAYTDVKHVLGESAVQDLDVYPVDKKGAFHEYCREVCLTGGFLVGSTKYQEPGLANRIHLSRSGIRCHELCG